MNLLYNSSSSDSDDELHNRRRRRRVFKPRVNMDFVTLFEYNERFRMSSIKLQGLLEDIGNHLEHQTNRNYALSAKQQISIALHWLGSGGQYHTVADMHGISKASVCRSLHSVVNAVNHIKFPTVVDFPENVGPVVQDFHAVAQMPQVYGCIDGTLVKIDAPSAHENDFVDRNGNHSINCMLVCGPDLKFYYASANWPGSVHDARVLRNSLLYQRFEAGWRPFPGAIILGDSAYPLREWLIPPTFQNVDHHGVRRFNRAHKSTRRLIENAIGILKEKFPCLNRLRVNPVFAAEIFKCCVTLCNLSKEPEDHLHIMEMDYLNEVFLENDQEQEVLLPAAQRRLQQLINHFL